MVFFRRIVNPEGLPMTQENLEMLVDELGLVSVICLLATICHDKAQTQLRLRGQSAYAYTAWKNNAFLLRQLMTKLRPTGNHDLDVDPTGD